MYDLWFPPRMQTGKSLVLVSDDPKLLDTPSIRNRVEKLEPLREIRVQGNGADAARYFVRVAHAYACLPADQSDAASRGSR